MTPTMQRQNEQKNEFTESQNLSEEKSKATRKTHQNCRPNCSIGIIQWEGNGTYNRIIRPKHTLRIFSHKKLIHHTLSSHFPTLGLYESFFSKKRLCVSQPLFIERTANVIFSKT